jgi:arylsulfatase A-like enzyme
MKPWLNRIYGEIVRVKDSNPEPWRILSEMDPRKLGGKPPAIELYDLKNDPDELHNLARDPAQRPQLQKLYSALKKWSSETRDSGAPLPELP